MNGIPTKYSFRHILFMTALVLFLLPRGTAQSLRFERLTIEEGFSQNTINCIFQDHNGFIWVGTQDGLNRYDGIEFTIYRHDAENINSLSHNWIWDIYEDSHNNLWVATWKGLNQYDMVRQEFTRFLPDSLNPKSIQGERPTSIVEDSHGYIWIGTWGGGLNRYDPETNTFYAFGHQMMNDNSLPSDFIRDIYLDNAQHLWIGTWNGLAFMDTDIDGNTGISRITLKNNESEADNLKVTSLCQVSDHEIWIGTLGEGIFVLDPRNEQVNRHLHQPDETGTINSNDVSVIFKDRKGFVWVGTVADGLNRYDRNKKSFISIKHDAEMEYSLAGNYVHSIYEDKTGLIWIGANGLNKFNRITEHFKRFKNIPNNPNSLDNNRVMAFCEDADGNIWIATDGSLNKFYAATGKFRHYLFEPDKSNSLTDNNLTSIVKDNEENLWIGTGGGGLNYLNRRSGQFIHYREDPAIPGTKGLDYITSLHMEGKILWIGTFAEGLIRMNTSQRTFQRFHRNSGDTSSLPGNHILNLHMDSKGVLWIGTWGAGLVRYDRKLNDFRHFQHHLDDPTSLQGNIIESILETSNKGNRYLWVGTNSGLSVAQLDQGQDLKFRTLSSKEGLPSNMIYGILEDNDHNLWFSTTNGLCKLIVNDSLLYTFDRHDGLQANEFNGGACFKLSTGELLFGGINGFNKFHPDSIRIERFSPKLIFTSFRISNDPIILGKDLAKPDPVTLTYRQNFFSVEFAAMDFKDPANHQYAYMLQGVDEDWVYSGHNRFARYADVDPGQFQFKIKAADQQGHWSPEETFIDIEIIPPYWQMWWFKTIVIVLFILAIYLFHRLRVKKILEMERLRTRIASDLHDDFGAALTRIAIHSEQIQNSNDQSRIRDISQKIGEISREVISSMSDIVWSIDTRNDTVKDLLDRMNELNLSLLVQENINVNFSREGINLNKKIPVNLRQNLYYIYKEAVNNIAKHANARQVRVRLENSKTFFTLMIEDDGIGFDLGSVKKGNGLKNMQMRADRIDADLNIIQNEGTAIIVKGPAL